MRSFLRTPWLKAFSGLKKTWAPRRVRKPSEWPGDAAMAPQAVLDDRPSWPTQWNARASLRPSSTQVAMTCVDAQRADSAAADLDSWQAARRTGRAWQVVACVWCTCGATMTRLRRVCRAGHSRDVRLLVLHRARHSTWHMQRFHCSPACAYVCAAHACVSFHACILSIPRRFRPRVAHRRACMRPSWRSLHRL